MALAEEAAEQRHQRAGRRQAMAALGWPLLTAHKAKGEEWKGSEVSKLD